MLLFSYEGTYIKFNPRFRMTEIWKFASELECANLSKARRTFCLSHVSSKRHVSEWSDWMKDHRHKATNYFINLAVPPAEVLIEFGLWEWLILKIQLLFQMSIVSVRVVCVNFDGTAYRTLARRNILTPRVMPAIYTRNEGSIEFPECLLPHSRSQSRVSWQQLLSRCPATV
jgi:hypothetical protein